MIIEEEFGNDYYGNLVIENYPNLEKIVVKKKSLKNLNSLKICNNEKLKTIEIEPSDYYSVTNEDYLYSSFQYVGTVQIESILLLII